MKPKTILCLMLVLSGGLFGCSTLPLKNERNTRMGVQQNVQLPIKFASYHEAYAFIAKDANGGEDLGTNENTLFKLAMDSKTQIVALSDDIPSAYVIESRYFTRGGGDQIRGAQGNGQYYVLRPLATNDTESDADKSLELIGILDGNSWTLSYSNGMPQIVTLTHVSADETPETIYKWNGKYFQP